MTRIALPLSALVLASGLGFAADSDDQNELTAAEKSAGWVLLFDGDHAGEHLRAYKGDTVPDAWKVEDDCLVLRGKGGDLVTKDEYKDFEFSIDWKISEGGNSGIMWHVTEDHGYPWETGPEMQVLDDAKHADGKSRLTSAGACYALYPAPEGAVKPAGQWNTARILVVGPKVTYTLNGVKTAEFDMSSQEWKDKLAGSKFKGMPDFGKRPAGHIAIQDHGDVVWYRNIKIRPIGATEKPAAPAAPAAGGTAPEAPKSPATKP